ncbi:hypothetical protein GP486_003300 [Trichoglossum hirsutum]|uniref:YMC020W-like alpha/beta hydrolase domain-containing protein n=1 Tax=Trichoglossum hirsutum TaxID=265104 RepID=A0A9P8RRA2_9PEZI|nr:hypothetical protein GP486_003300 [Trichoglossum hirsutum]
MGSRKRTKPNPTSESPVDGSAVEPIFPPSSNPDTPGCSLITTDGEGCPTGQVDARSGLDTQASARSWYGGTWPRISKSIPITQVARETVSTASSVNEAAGSLSTSKPPERPATPKVKPSLRSSPSLHFPRSIQNSPRSLPVAAATTKVNITSNGLVDGCASEDKPGVAKESSAKLHEGEPVGIQKTPNGLEGQEKAPTVPVADLAIVPQSSWLDWFSRTPVAEHVIEPQRPSQEAFPTEGVQAGPQEDCLMEIQSLLPKQPLNQSDGVNNDLDATSITQRNRTWFWFWSASAPTQCQSEHPTSGGVLEANNSSEALPTPGLNIARKNKAKGSVDTSMAEASPELSPAKTKPLPDRSSGWAFWSRERTKSTTDSSVVGDNVDELVVPDMPLQSHPQASNYEQMNTSTKFEAAKLGKRARPKSLDMPEDSVSNMSQAVPSTQQTPTQGLTPSKSKSAEKTAKQPKALPANLLLPSFHSTYRPQESTSVLQQLSRLLLQGKQTLTKHVRIVRDPPPVKKAIAIGIHGYFPAPLIRTLLGQPTGTSIRFANSAAAAIKRWTGSRGYECEIEKIALEGEGKIGERVYALWKLMLNWIDKIQKADLILVACHSQGVPVAIMLIAKLIDFCCLDAARIGVCAMAGVNLGPFPDYKSRLLNGSAGELFEFSDPGSVVSKRYEDAMKIAVDHGVRILFVGSIDDQLVSLESSTFSNINHPYIYRAVFVDGRVHAPDLYAKLFPKTSSFAITHLVGFALKLRNLGISDHGLIRELSAPLAGSLYTGEGHSRLYDDEIVYDLAIEHTLETSSVADAPLQVNKYETPTNSNPFILPWSMRGLLEEEYVRNELRSETAQLLEQFDNWKPANKALKDVKFRLEAVKSKL